MNVVRSQEFVGGVVRVAFGNAPYSDGDRTNREIALNQKMSIQIGYR